MPNSISLPDAPFDGQEFIDAYRIRWVYSSDAGCWAKRGTIPSIPEANEQQRGLLSARLKQVLDSVPQAGGHFSLIADPKLSTVPFRHNAILKAKIINVTKDEAGSSIQILENESSGYSENQFAGKAVLFITGNLANKTLSISGNDETTLFIQGPDAIHAKKGDKLEIIDTTALNKDGLIYGDIVFTSESLDITFVDGNGDEITGDCKVIKCDTPDSPPGINLRLSDTFIREFCVQIPGCRGARGDRGPKGASGPDGTGDGPKGEQGDQGDNATLTHTFTGIKIKDITDIFDTAVVGVDLDAAKGKLHVVKARVKTADNTKPADQVIASAISRDIQFTDDNFKYSILMPNGDPVGINNVTILHYPESFSTKNSIVDNKSGQYSIWNFSLTTVIDEIIAQYQNKLAEISIQYDTLIKPFIEQKDREARLILANLADQVAQCEFQLPIDFCLGVEPMKAQGGCNPEPQVNDLSSSELDILGQDFELGKIVKLPTVDIQPTSTTDEPDPEDPVVTVPTDTVNSPSDRYPQPSTGTLESSSASRNNQRSHSSQPIKYTNGSTQLPAGTYMIQWVDGSGRVDNGPHHVGVTINYSDSSGDHSVDFTEPSEVSQYNWDPNAYSSARKNLSLDKNSVSFTLVSTGSATATFQTSGNNPQGSVKLQPVRALKTNETDLGIPITEVAISGTVGTTGGGGGGGNPECNQTVNCGDFDPAISCPSCAPEIHATTITPTTVSIGVPTLVTIIGSGFVDPVNVFVSGPVPSTPVTVVSQTNTVLTVLMDLTIADPYDIEINMGDSVAYAPNGITAV